MERIFEKLRREKYSIENKEIQELEEYKKNLYFIFLCSVLENEKNPVAAQFSYLDRLLKGYKAETLSVEEYIKIALQIEEPAVREFLRTFEKSHIKYYFLLDSLILLRIGEQGKEKYKYLSELIELLNINKSDLSYICMVARAILEQDSNLFEQSKTIRNIRVENLNFQPYLKEYYTGIVVDTSMEKYYYAADIEQSVFIKINRKYNEKIVIFENMKIYIDAAFNFWECEQVIFKNCILYGKGEKLHLYKVNTLRIDHCIVKDFKHRVVETEGIFKLQILHSKFRNCGQTGINAEYGGVFNCTYSGAIQEIWLVGNEFENCYIARKEETNSLTATDAILHFSGKVVKMRVEGNKFSGCSCINNSTAREACIGHGDIIDLICKDNTFTNGITRLFRKDRYNG